MGTKGLEWALYYISLLARLNLYFCLVLMVTGASFLHLFRSSLKIFYDPLKPWDLEGSRFSTC